MAPEFKYSRLPKWKWRLEESYRYWTPIRNIYIDTPYAVLQENGWLLLRAGYAWDGSTGVRDTKSSQAASAVHDVGYQMMRLGLLPQSYREAFDSMYYDFCIVYHMWKPRAWVRWKTVRRVAGPFAKPKGKPEIVIVT